MVEKSHLISFAGGHLISDALGANSLWWVQKTTGSSH